MFDNSGVWSDNYFTTAENQSIIWMPMNEITKYLYYISPDSEKNQRLVMSSPGLPRPIVWIISKIESAQPLGVNKITLYQTEWNSDTDYIDQGEIANGDLFAMYANYYSSYGFTDPEDSPKKAKVNAEILVSNTTIKVGGSYKLLTLKVTDPEGKDITNDYIENLSITSWHCYVGNEDLTDLVTWSEQSVKNKMKIKFGSDRNYIGKTLRITCAVSDDTEASVLLDIGAL